MVKMKLTTCILIIAIQKVSSFTFEDANVAGVEFLTSSSPQVILVDENNNGGRTDFIKITGVTGNIALTQIGQDVQLGAELNSISSDTYILSGNLFDFEKFYPLQNGDNTIISLQDSSDQKQLVIRIKNLIDENPTLTTSPCLMNEITDYNVQNSPCNFTISDPDGFLATLNLEGIIDSGRNENSLFSLEYKDIPFNTTYTSPIYLVLQNGQQLDYEVATLYSFRIQITDSAGNPTIPLPSVPALVQVEDMPNRPPVWEFFPYFVRVTEKTPSSTHVSARDGDFGINNEINYYLTFPENTSNDITSVITINKQTGVIEIGSINRDEGYDQVVVTVTAYEVGEEDSTATDTLTILVEDIDDNVAVITINNTSITVDEGSSQIPVTISASDIDFGSNALYTAKLTATNDDFLTAFQIIPNQGFEQTQLTLAVTNTTKLDYEDPAWIIITIQLQTIGVVTPTNIDEVSITIYLNDINDEFPIFDKDQYDAEVREDVDIGYKIIFIQATDKDQEDIDAGVNHEILGAVANYLTIQEKGGDVTTRTDNAFDYEKQTQVFVTIRALDAADHAATTQLTINVIDVNDEDPRITVTTSFEIDENQDDGAVIATGEDIVAVDVDTQAHLEFSIDWSLSYATKNSKRIEPDSFKPYTNCINVETVPSEDNNYREVSAKLTIRETVPKNTPDYELFDTLFIRLTVNDTTTEKGNGTDNALIVITVNNINDNAPVFTDDTRIASRQVVENSNDGTTVGTVTATDADMDNITYSIKSAKSDTPEWIGIESGTGNLFVSLQGNNVIDCDDPVRWNLTYTVTAFDGLFHTPIDITIHIIDQNDNAPVISNSEISIPEDDEQHPENTQNGTDIFHVQYIDIDRDEPFNLVACQVSSTNDPEVRSRFRINDNNNIMVWLATGATLDREDIRAFKLQAECTDNPPQQGAIQNSASPPPIFDITLEDVNDKKPIIVTTNIEAFNENSLQINETRILIGQDDDEGDNGKINFFLTKIEAFAVDDYTNGQMDVPQDLFTLKTEPVDKKNATLIVANNLRQFHGYYNLTIKTTDDGNPSLTTEENTVTLPVRRYNFEEILITFPTINQTIYLSLTQTPNDILKLWNSGNLQSLTASDQQDNKYQISFDIITSDSPQFYIDSSGNLKMSSIISSEQKYTITAEARLRTDDTPLVGEKPYSKNITFYVDFLDEDSTDPVFDIHEISTTFKENTTGQFFEIPSAGYPQLEELQGLLIYYLLREESEIFYLDQHTGNLTLKEILDYETVTSYEILIQSSNSQDIKTTASDDTKLTLTIEVLDINDNPPVFEYEQYYGTVVVGSANKEVATVKANDLDTTSQGRLQYKIEFVKNSVNDEQQNDRFIINSATGDITAQFEPTDSSKEYYTLNVTVEDEPPESHQDKTTVYIYIVTKNNVVEFKFENSVDSVRNLRDQIRQTLDDTFGYKSNVEAPSVVPNSDSDVTLVPVYFIDAVSNKPIEAVDILRQVTNVTAFRIIKAKFADSALLLMSFDSEATANQNLEEILKAWLIGISVVLGSLSLILLVAFTLKTRALNKRITKLSRNKFGSQESGLNRQGITAPTTNKHAIEGSNPVYNNTVDSKELDRASVASGDSDLIGVEDDEKFQDFGEKERY